MLGFLTAVIAVELVVVHLLLPEGPLRLVALLLSVWGIVFVWSLIASERIRPSYATGAELVLRRGKRVFASVPYDAVDAVRRDRSFASDVEVADGVLVVGGPAGTDTLVELSRPVEAAQDGYPWQKVRTVPVTRVRFHAGEEVSLARPSNPGRTG